MSRRGITELGNPPFQFRVDKHCAGFETTPMSVIEDMIRAKQITRAAIKYPKEVDPDAAKILAETLEGMDGATHSSLASSTHMRALRVKICSHVWKLVTEVKTRKVRAFTIIPATGVRTPAIKGAIHRAVAPN